MNPKTETLIEAIFRERPAFHAGETEVGRKITTAESMLPSESVQSLADGKADCYGIDADVGRFIAAHVNGTSHSLETGAGLSTLVFALQGSNHVSVTPNGQETEAIRRYAVTKDIKMDSVRFVIEPSDQYLPTAKLPALDFVFIDGKHAFPWPVIDWFYTVDRMKQNGVILIDDVHMISGKMLVDFMAVDPRWQRLADFNQKTCAFKKMTPLVHDVAWHMQPYVVNALAPAAIPGTVAARGAQGEIPISINECLRTASSSRPGVPSGNIGGTSGVIASCSIFWRGATSSCATSRRWWGWRGRCSSRCSPWS